MTTTRHYAPTSSFTRFEAQALIDAGVVLHASPHEGDDEIVDLDDLTAEEAADIADGDGGLVWWEIPAPPLHIAFYPRSPADSFVLPAGFRRDGDRVVREDGASVDARWSPGGYAFDDCDDDFAAAFEAILRTW